MVLFSNETRTENEVSFEKLVHRARKLRNIWNIRESAGRGDVRLERKLSFDFAKLKAKGQLRSAFMPQNEERPSRYFSASVDRTTKDRSRTEALDPPNPRLVVGSVV